MIPEDDKVLANFQGSNLCGLSGEEAARRLQRYGFNEIVRKAGESPWAQLAGQFTSAMIWLLIGAGWLSIALGEIVDGIAILSVVLQLLIHHVQLLQSLFGIQLISLAECLASLGLGKHTQFRNLSFQHLAHALVLLLVDFAPGESILEQVQGMLSVPIEDAPFLEDPDGAQYEPNQAGQEQDLN